jgi:hypothetical protein
MADSKPTQAMGHFIMKRTYRIKPVGSSLPCRKPLGSLAKPRGLKD